MNNNGVFVIGAEEVNEAAEEIDVVIEADVEVAVPLNKKGYPTVAMKVPRTCHGCRENEAVIEELKAELAVVKKK